MKIKRIGVDLAEKVNSKGIPCLLLVELDKVGSKERLFKGFTRFWAG